MRVWLLGLFLFPVFAPAKEIRVRLVHAVRQIRLTVHKGTVASDGRTLLLENGEVEFASGHWSIRDDTHHWDLPFESLEIDGEAMTLNDSKLPSRIQLKTRPGMLVDIITVLPMESYLRGVIPAEMPANWPIEALKAQAVAARSYAYRRLEEHKDDDFDLDGDINDQAFIYQAAHPRQTDLALNQTKDLILYENHEVLNALYHADCGGMTEEAAAVWGSDAGSNSTVHPDCPHPTHTWTRQLDRAFLSIRLAKYFNLPSSTKLQNLRAESHSASGRIKSILVSMADGSSHHISSQDFRQVVGFHRVPSTTFQMTWIDDSHLKLAGVGQGHGVGLCQLGAKALAERGETYQQILGFYYPKTTLTSVTR